jgi:phosphatidylglycerophosphate synthase
VRDARLVGATGVVLWILVSPTVGGSAIAGIAWWLVVTLMLEWHVGMLETPDGRQLDRLGAANVLSLARAWLVPLLPLLHGWMLGLALLAAVASDVLDGRLARARGQITRLGRWLDGTVDTVIVGASGVAAMTAGIAPGWVGATLICRAALPWAAVGAAYFVRRESPRIAASAPGRVLGGVSMGGLILAAFGLGAGAYVAAAGALAGVAVVGVAIVRAAGPGARQPAA